MVKRKEHPLQQHREYIITLLAEGKNYAQISNILNYSRFAVCRWCFRNNLKLQIPVEQAKKIWSTPRGETRKIRTKHPHPPRAQRNLDDAPTDAYSTSLFLERYAKTVSLGDYPHKVHFAHTTAENCMFPLWDSYQTIGFVCGAYKPKHLTYCATCAGIAYVV
jgi:hypothetical protein